MTGFSQRKGSALPGRSVSGDGTPIITSRISPNTDLLPCAAGPGALVYGRSATPLWCRAGDANSTGDRRPRSAQRDRPVKPVQSLTPPLLAPGFLPMSARRWLTEAPVRSPDVSAGRSAYLLWIGMFCHVLENTPYWKSARRLPACGPKFDQMATFRVLRHHADDVF
jgi:hypothetical protein